MGKVYYICGSPCCGKTTFAKRMAEEKGLYHFEADEYLYYAIMKGKEEGKPHCTRQAEVFGDEKWLRDPFTQAKEEVALYEEIFPYVMEVLEGHSVGRNVIAEGVVFLPVLMEDIIRLGDEYCCMIPEEKFQIEQYRKRTWVKEVLKTSTDREKAFSNWMKRDTVFAKVVRDQALERNVNLFVVDGTVGIDEFYYQNRNLFPIYY